MRTSPRYRAAFIAAGIHFICSAVVAGLAAGLVFGMWYPYPYRELAGGRELFLLVVAVDVVCGPLLTAVLFNPAKSREELWRDLSLVAVIQLIALGYGLHTVWQARPLFLAHEVAGPASRLSMLSVKSCKRSRATPFSPIKYSRCSGWNMSWRRSP